MIALKQPANDAPDLMMLYLISKERHHILELAKVRAEMSERMGKVGR